MICTLGFGYLASRVASDGWDVLLELNHYVFTFLMVGMLLHWRPRSFVNAIASAVGPVGGVLILPALRGHREDDDGVRARDPDGALLRPSVQRAHVPGDDRHLFRVSRAVHPVRRRQVADRSAVHAGRGKTLEVHLGWVVQTYNATEALANLIHPFWMLPLVGILGLKARDIVGYSMLQFAVHALWCCSSSGY